jgi:hypothetical protein
MPSTSLGRRCRRQRRNEAGVSALAADELSLSGAVVNQPPIPAGDSQPAERDAVLRIAGSEVDASHDDSGHDHREREPPERTDADGPSAHPASRPA